MNNDQIKRKVLGTHRLEADMPSRSVLSWITTDAVDDEGEVLLPDGLDFSRFDKTRGVFWSHDYSREPCGVCDGLERDEHGVKARTVFPARPEGHTGEWLPDDVLAMFSSEPPLLRCFSIGFQYLETRAPTAKDRQRFRGKDIARVVSKARVLEYSVAPLPMNEDCVALAVRKGFDPAVAKRLGIVVEAAKVLVAYPRVPVMAAPPVIVTPEEMAQKAAETVQVARGRVYA